MNAAFIQSEKNRLGLSFQAVVAMTPSRVIGKDGTLPWRLPEDLQTFKRLTTGHPIVMGRKTFDSLKRPLPNRQNIVLTRDASWTAEGAERILAPEDLFSLNLMNTEVKIIGGAEIFSLFLPFMDTLWISKIHEEYPGDTFFPEFESLYNTPELVESFQEFDLWKYTQKPSSRA